MDSLHEIAISAPMGTVLDAWITGDGLRAWWTSDVTSPQRDGDPYVFGFDGGKVRFHFRVIEKPSSRGVRMVGVDGPGMPPEWVGTEFDVRLSQAEDGRTLLRFAHRGWRSIEGAFCVCNTTWGELLYRLRDWCEGRPRGPLFSS